MKPANPYSVSCRNMSTGKVGVGRFVVVFNKNADPKKAETSTVFAAMMLMGVRILDGSLPVSVLVEGREEHVAVMLEGYKDWTYTAVEKLGSKTV